MGVGAKVQDAEPLTRPDKVWGSCKPSSSPPSIEHAAGRLAGLLVALAAKLLARRSRRESTSVDRGNSRLNREALEPGHYGLPLQEEDGDIIIRTTMASRHLCVGRSCRSHFVGYASALDLVILSFPIYLGMVRQLW
ncbi:hypothetical protein KC345_g191 [Hortaea werneckii]|nr:hypothetical protein KC345_g191 [Hortaea werneckii]